MLILHGLRLRVYESVNINVECLIIPDHPEIPQRTGKLKEVNKFDAAFFGVHYKQAHTMDPMCRIILEKAYEAIVDSGEKIKILIILIYWNNTHVVYLINIILWA